MANISARRKDGCDVAKKQQGNFKCGIGYLTGQTYLNLFLATIYSMILCGAIKSLFADQWWSLLLMGVVCLVLDGGMVYQFMWRQGDKEANYIQFGRIEREPYKGLKVGLLAMIPYGVMDIVLALSLAKVLPFDFLRTFRILNAPLYGFMKLIHRDWGWATATTPGLSWGAFVVLALMPLVYVVFCTVGYELGVRHISIKEKLVYKQEK